MPKKRKIKKPDAAARKLASDWAKLVMTHSAPLERGAKAKSVTSKRIEPKFTPPSKVEVDPRRDLKRHPSLNTAGGSTSKRMANTYTGDKMLGLGTMHKSNTVPIFSAEDAVEISKMRRN